MPDPEIPGTEWSAEEQQPGGKAARQGTSGTFQAGFCCPELPVSPLKHDTSTVWSWANKEFW